ncbi:ABC transporter substrate-binding protein [Brucella intermedia]|uniref:ABC transporter substrate-binding protein n=1 Tax=Brucella intermedia TaxID=94625 RepID=UPI002B0531C7|nr:extracellular solute-binding protein [Brucella intermedia]
MIRINRRAFLTTSLLAAPAIMTASRAFAQERSLQFGNFASLQGKTIRDSVIPKFEEDFKCKVYSTDGATLTHMASLRATKGKPKYDVVLMDDTGVGVAKNEDLIVPIMSDAVPNIKNVIKRFVIEDGYGTGFAVSAGGLYINPQLTKPLESYGDLWDSRFQRKFLMGTPKYTQSTFLLIAVASVITGKPFKEAQYLIDDKVWSKMAELKQNVLTIYDATSQVMMVPQGQAVVGGIEYTKNVYPLKAKGIPIDMVFPKEGAFAGVNCITMAKNSSQPELAAAFINRILSPEVQKLLAEATFTAPSITGLKFDETISPYLIYPEDKLDQMNLFMPDWSYINPNRPKWLEKYNEVFGS